MDIEAVRHAYALKPFTQGIVSKLNPDIDLVDLEADRVQIGYPAHGL